MMKTFGILFFLFFFTQLATSAFYSGPFESERWQPDEKLTPVHPVFQRGEAAEEQEVSFYVALAYSEATRDSMRAKLLAISDPQSAQYGKHMSISDIAAQYGPSQATVNKVTRFFVQSISGARVVPNLSNDMLRITAKQSAIEKGLGTTLMWHETSPKGRDYPVLRAVSAIRNIPDDVAQHLSFVSLNSPVTRPLSDLQRRHRESIAAEIQRAALATEESMNGYTLRVIRGNEDAILLFRNVSCGLGDNVESPPCASFETDEVSYALEVSIHFYENDQSNPRVLSDTPLRYTLSLSAAECIDINTSLPCNSSTTAFADCYCFLRLAPLPKYKQMRAHLMVHAYAEDGTMACVYMTTSPLFALTDIATPQFLSELYNLPLGLRIPTGSQSTQAVAEFYGEFYSNSDLHSFLKLSGLPQATLSPSNVYGDLPNDEQSPGGEAQLDIEYIMALAPGATTSFYSIGTLNPYDPTNEGFLDYLYLVGNQTKVPLVHSLSYGDVEATIFNASNPGSSTYGYRCDDEFLKMGLRGITVVFSSGDDGSGNFIIRQDPARACSKAWPSWPASSPYVTSVGATQLSPQYLPLCGKSYDLGSVVGALSPKSQLKVACTSVAETVCSSTFGGIITSGGGFSEVYNRSLAPWQSAFVDNYLANPSNIPPSNFFHSIGRAYPDVSAYGSNYFVYLEDQLVRESGTSASAPVFAAMVTQWNQIRLAKKLSPLGFINPLLYTIASAKPEAFRDITTGNIACGVGYSMDTVSCCNHTFYSAPGWDATTGLGTPNFGLIAQYIDEMESAPVPPEEDHTPVSAVGVTALVISLCVLCLSIYTFYLTNKFGRGTQYGIATQDEEEE